MSSKLIDIAMARCLARLPHLGPKSAKRIAYHLLANKTKTLAPLIEAMQFAMNSINPCQNCGAFCEGDLCAICCDIKRSHTLICVVEDMFSIELFESARMFHGVYHILGGHLCAISGITAEDLNIKRLLERIEHTAVEEIVFALSPTVEGQTTFYYLLNSMKGLARIPKISTLAHGVPVGAHINHIDEQTLTFAFDGRKEITFDD